jgi:hypothetical protein
MASKLYPQNHQLGAVVENKDCGSDIEEGENDRILSVQMIPDWRALELTTVLHHFDKMVQAHAVHHKTKLVNKQVYGRSKSKYRITKGINGVPRGLPQDCYSAQWWNGLGQYKKDIVSKVGPFGMGELAAKLGEHMSKNQHPRPGPNAGPSNQTGSTHQVEESHQEGERSAGGTKGVMHVD